MPHSLAVPDDIYEGYRSKTGLKQPTVAMVLALERGLQARAPIADDISKDFPGITPKPFERDPIASAVRRVLLAIDGTGQLAFTDVPQRIERILRQRPTVISPLDEEVSSESALITWLKPGKNVRDLRALVSGNLTKIENDWGIEVDEN